MDGLDPASLVALARESIGLVIAILLVVSLDRRLHRMVEILSSVEQHIKIHMAHQTSRMDEIRQAMTAISREMGRHIE